MRLIIIGAGPGGYETALEAAGRGIEVVLIESGEVGGTCLNEGCIPTKTLCRSAEVLAEARKAGEFGVLCGEPSLDFERVMARKQAVVEQLRGGVETLLHNKLITLVRGRAAMSGPHSVTVSVVTPVDAVADGEGVDQAGLEGETTEYTGDFIIIATGSTSAVLPIPGVNLPGVITSRELLDIDHLPANLCIIGAGVIGLEFASIFNSFGSKVTVLEYCKQILPRFDTDLAKRLKQSLSKSGIEIITSASVREISAAAGASGISSSAGALTVSYALESKAGTTVNDVTADTVLMAVGRRPSTASLALEAAGVEYGPKGIVVNEFMQTNVPSIYAIGDVNGRCMLAHAATAQGTKALNHICNTALSGWRGTDKTALQGGICSDKIDLSIIPSAVFTMPEAATVGLTEQDCEHKGIRCRCLKSFYRSNGKAVSLGETDGFVKMIVASDTEEILGCHLFGPHASDLIAEITALINCGATLTNLRSIIHAHPTLSEVLSALV